MDIERKLWTNLRSHPILGIRFVGQFPVAYYIADFACREDMLIVELDGSQHDDNPYDASRTTAIEGLGYRVLRFWNRDVIGNPEGVVLAIEAELMVAI